MRSEASREQRRAHARHKYATDRAHRRRILKRSEKRREHERELKARAERYADSPRLLALDELTAVLAKLREGNDHVES